MVPNRFKELMLEKCPKCGRQGYRVIKKVTNQYHTRQYAVEYFKHKEGRPVWCYIKRVKEKDGSTEDWNWSTKYNNLL